MAVEFWRETLSSFNSPSSPSSFPLLHKWFPLVKGSLLLSLFFEFRLLSFPFFFSFLSFSVSFSFRLFSLCLQVARQPLASLRSSHFLFSIMFSILFLLSPFPSFSFFNFWDLFCHSKFFFLFLFFINPFRFQVLPCPAGKIHHAWGQGRRKRTTWWRRRRRIRGRE